jgi:hypothetical protein
MIYYAPPQVSKPQVALILTSKIKILKTIIDHMSKLSKTIELTCMQIGRLVFKIDGICSISTYISDLQPCFDSINEDNERENIAIIHADIKKLSLLLNIQQLSIYSATLCK